MRNDEEENSFSLEVKSNIKKLVKTDRYYDKVVYIGVQQLLAIAESMKNMVNIQHIDSISRNKKNDPISNSTLEVKFGDNSMTVTYKPDDEKLYTNDQAVYDKWVIDEKEREKKEEEEEEKRRKERNKE